MKNLNQHDSGPRHRHPIRYIFFSGLVISALSVYLTKDWANIGNLTSDNKDIKATQIPSPKSAYARILPSAAPAIAGEVVQQPTSPLTAADPQQSNDLHPHSDVADQSTKIHIAFSTEWNFDHQYVEDSISYLQDGDLPNVSMPRICWDEHGEYYSQGAVVVRGDISYQCTFIGEMAGAPAFFWESI